MKLGNQWKPIQGFEGMYEISSDDLVKSLKRKFVPKERIRRGSINSGGTVRAIITYKRWKHEVR